VSFPCGLEHLRRCTGSTRWWSVDWHLCQPRYPRFVHFSWSFPVNWYIQSILLYPAIKSVTFVSASLPHSHAQLQTCLVSLFQAFIPTGGIQTPMPSTCLFITPLTLRYDYHLPFLFGATGRPMLSSEYNSPRTRHDLYTPTLLFFLSKSFIFSSHLGELCTIFMFSTLLFILHDPTVYRFSLPTRCGSSLITFIQPLHLDQVTTSLSRLYLNAFSSGPSLIGYPAVPSFLLASPIVLVFFLLSSSLFLFLLLILLPAPSAIFYPLFTNWLRRQKSNATTSFLFA